MSGFISPGSYAYWANCGVGSTVTTEQIDEMTQHFTSFRTVVTTTQTLLALDSEKATVGIFVRGAGNGAPLEMKNTFEILAHPEPEAQLPRVARGGDENEGWEVSSTSWDQMFKGTTPKETVETLEVAGRSLVCQRIDQATAAIALTFWMSDQVPGGLARMEARGADHFTKSTVTAFEKK